ncbi:hypothetical protein MferCBS31731_002982 [Microsporum ferrugineum]|uniref:CipC protein n=1 Tax=Arthroderma otae (strain ATCC MYA-4605 / CBS 113480) TaxID=554155 RepID=C5FU43_ARTOC|nr:CipC protein [Microsporum canis CBS 113480]EEQ33427.1 CipC protein [Microsporum canis CBS 113480]
MDLMALDFSDHASAHEEVMNAPHKASLSHELIAGAAAYEAAKAYEEHVQRNGKPESHAKAKELLAGFAGAFTDRIIETKGLDFIDREKVKRQAHEHAQDALGREY